ncbi:hypothetical protein [Aurantiacibacter spongiae]|uniref:Lipoprotein n=1 Tax=Aurantiacibacter spongiae TaxID=2488860 RepID=A0A3N5CQF6_9SPHN|nr:hypothetical protein [Aurantiacibacter spongiae]RPF70616.1 hypothetical protein EG799_02475 [Aurantiacibacter spongiae]
MKIAAIPAALALGALSGCMTYEVDESGVIVPDEQLEPYAEWPSELSGRTVRVETDDGTVNEINFAPDGTMTILVDPGGPTVQGIYGMRDDNTVCVNFVPRGEECWPYRPMQVGETMMVTSNRGQELRVTMLDK